MLRLFPSLYVPIYSENKNTSFCRDKQKMIATGDVIMITMQPFSYVIFTLVSFFENLEEMRRSWNLRLEAR